MTQTKTTAGLMLAALLASTGMVSAQSLAEIEAAAKAEGMLTTIALPHSWCGYGDVIAGFKAKYPEIQVNELNPDAGSADEVEAVKANKDNKGPQAPDVVEHAGREDAVEPRLEPHPDPGDGVRVVAHLRRRARAG